MKKYKRLIIYIAVFGVAALLIYEILVTQLPDLWGALQSGNEADIERFLSDSDRWTGMIFLGLLQIIQVISIVIPSAPIHLAGGMVYGAVRGYLLCHLCYIFANVCIIYSVRKFSGLSELLGNSNQQKIQKALKLINQGDPFVTIMLLCMLPIIPNGIIPYAASQMDIRIRDFAKAVAAGSVYSIASMVLCGKFILTGDYLISGLLVVMNLAVVALLYRYRIQVSELVTRIKNRHPAGRKRP